MCIRYYKVSKSNIKSNRKINRNQEESKELKWEGKTHQNFKSHFNTQDTAQKVKTLLKVISKPDRYISSNIWVGKCEISPRLYLQRDVTPNCESRPV